MPMTLFGRFLACDRGATAIEYTMIAAGVGGFIAATVFMLGDTVLTNLYSQIAAAVTR